MNISARLVHLSVASVLLAASSGGEVPAPPNDFFAQAALLSGTRLTAASWNYGASVEEGEPKHAGQLASRSVWWRWTAPYSELVELKTDRSSLDTVLVVYTGPSLTKLQGVATNDNAGEWLNSRLVFPAQAGTTYWIAVDGKDGQQGSIWLWLNAEDVSTLVPLDHLGSWPGGNTGHPMVVWPAGDRAYVAQQEGGLAILDITDPAHPVRLGGIQTAHSAEDVCVVGDYAYVADGNQGVQVIRVTDPKRPVRVAGYPGEAHRVRAAGTLLYVAAGWQGLEIVDISEREHPVRVGGFDTPTWVQDVDVANGFAYVADPPTGLLILSVADPANPTQLGKYALASGEVSAVRVAGIRAYVGLSVAGVDIVNVADPTAPAFLGHYSPSEAQARSIDVVGEHAYIADGWGGLLILDVSHPTDPFRVGSLSLGDFAVGVVVRDSLAFLAGSRGGVEIIDVAAPASPVLRGAWDEAEVVRNVNATNSHAFLAAETRGLAILEVSHPETPALLASAGTLRFPRDVELTGHYAYVAGGENNAIEVFDIHDVAQPRSVGIVSTGGDPVDSQVGGAYAYVASTPLTVLDVHDLEAPQAIASLDVGCCSRNVALAGDYVYVAASDSGLQIVDVTTPTAPALVGHYDTPGAATGLASVGRLLYLSATSGFEILDVADPAAPVRLGGLDRYGLSVQVDGRYAYVAGGFEGVLVLDVRDPNLPAIAAQYRTRAHTERVHVADGRIYVADLWGGLSILASPFPPNSPPIITDIPDQGMPVREDPGDPPLTVSFTVQDADTMADYLLVSVSSSDPALLPASAMVLGGNGAERSLELAPAPGASGTAMVTVMVSDGQLVTADAFLLEIASGETPPYATDFNRFATGTIHGQDGWEAMDERGSWGNILELDKGNKVLAIVGGRPGDIWGGEVRRLYQQPSTRRFLTVTFDYLIASPEGFWFMDNYAPGFPPESLFFGGDGWVRSNADPSTHAFWTETAQWHRIGIEADQAARRMTFVMFDGTWLREDDSRGVVPPSQPDRFIFRGASNDGEGAQWYPELWIDNLSITDSDSSAIGSYVNRQTPYPGETGVLPIQFIEVEILDGPAEMVEPESSVLMLDGVAVAPAVNKSGVTTTLHYQPPVPFASDSEHKVSLSFRAGGGEYAQAWGFRVVAYPTLAPELRAMPTSEPGFLWRVAQADLPYILPNSLERAEEQLTGLILGEDGQPAPNSADPSAVGAALGPAASADPYWAPITFEIASVINLDEWGGGGVGNFGPDDPMPGIPGTGSLTPMENVAAEILTLIELPAGLIVMGVNSDDGFRTTVGDLRDPCPLILGQFDGGRGAADTLFAFEVREAGVYPFRTIWEEGAGGANIEWFTLQSDGSRVLVNDVANGGLHAWRPAPPPPPTLPANEVVLTARCVRSASDIERAIERATAHGTRPGIVTLDASAGDFRYTGEDREIDIQRSNLTLRSLNGAMLPDCSTGVLLGGASADNVVIKGLTFMCEYFGLNLREGGPHQGLVLRNNVFRVRESGVMAGGVGGWTIESNTIEAGTWRSAIGLYNSAGIRVSGNHLAGGDGVLHLEEVQDAELSRNEVVAADFTAVVLVRVTATEVSGNTVAAPVWGITVLDGEAATIQIVNNTVAMAPGSADAISISRSSGVKIVNNDVRSNSLGIHFFESRDCEAVNNLIQGGWEGVLVGTGGCGHKIVNNRISEVESAGLSFEGANFGNQVTANRVMCASPGACQLIKAGDGDDFYRNNKVQANRLMR